MLPTSDGPGGRLHLQGRAGSYRRSRTADPVHRGGQRSGATIGDPLGATLPIEEDPQVYAMSLLQMSYHGSLPPPLRAEPHPLGPAANGKQPPETQGFLWLCLSLTPKLPAGSLLSLDSSPGGRFLWLSWCLFIFGVSKSLLGSLLGLSVCGPPLCAPPPPHHRNPGLCFPITLHACPGNPRHRKAHRLCGPLGSGLFRHVDLPSRAGEGLLCLRMHHVTQAF